MNPTRRMPTPEEIVEICAEIRKTWDNHRWARSTVYQPADYLIPGANTGSVTPIPSEWYRRNEPED